VARFILMDEFQLTVYAPCGLPEADYDAITRALSGGRLRRRLLRVARRVLRRHPALQKVRLTLTR
jgi:hypothetical protein